jgi:hypothetical protein
MITTALSSNLYHNGLAAIDYMRVKEKLSPYIPDGNLGNKSNTKENTE